MRLSLLVVAICGAVFACEPAPAARQGGADAATLAQARAAVEARYAAHWRGGQGFSADTLRARKAWFTPAFYQLLLADMSGDEIGIVDYDPFTDAQDDGARFVVGNPRAGHDTVYVPVEVRFDSASEAQRSVTLAMVRDSSAWRIGDFIDGDGSLAGRLRK